jgi:malonyl-CoA O-methyltransferase
MLAQTDIQDKQAITRHFSRAAVDYDRYSFIQEEIGRRLLERCQWLKTEPQTILNIGSATGRFTDALQNSFPKACIIGLDRALNMCEVATQKYSKSSFICADMETLPFRAKSFDCIVSNCTLEWSRVLPTLMSEFKRVLKTEGALLFSTVGPDTLFELAHSTYKMDGHYHVNAFLDMPGSAHLFQTLKTPFRGHAGLKELIQQYAQFKGAAGYPATIEIIYGYAYKKIKKSCKNLIPTDIFVD